MPNTMMNGTMKNSTSQIIGTAVTSGLPICGCLRSWPAGDGVPGGLRGGAVISIEAHHRARGIPAQVHRLVPGEQLLGLARAVRLRDAHLAPGIKSHHEHR